MNQIMKTTKVIVNCFYWCQLLECCILPARTSISFELAGWPCGSNSLDLMCKYFLGRLELKTPIFLRISKIKKLLLEIERTLLIFDYY